MTLYPLLPSCSLYSDVATWRNSRTSWNPNMGKHPASYQRAGGCETPFLLYALPHVASGTRYELLRYYMWYVNTLRTPPRPLYRDQNQVPYLKLFLSNIYIHGLFPYCYIVAQQTVDLNIKSHYAYSTLHVVSLSHKVYSHKPIVSEITASSLGFYQFLTLSNVLSYSHSCDHRPRQTRSRL